MKKILMYMILSISIYLFFIGNVYADELDFVVDASVSDGISTVASGETVTIDVKINSNLHINTCQFEVSSDNNVEYIEVIKTGNYDVSRDDNGVISVNDSSNETTATIATLLKLKYKVNNNGNVTIKTLNCTSTTDNKSGIYEDVNVKLSITEPEDDITLSHLVVNGGTLSPTFSPETHAYSIQLTGTEFSLNLTASNSEYQDKIGVFNENGDKLNPEKIVFDNSSGKGQMQISIKINNEVVYTLLAVYVEETLDNSLRSLKVDGVNIPLESGKYEYIVKIDKNAKNVKIEATLMDNEHFTFVDGFGGSTNFSTIHDKNTCDIIILPVDSQIGAEGVHYFVTLVKDTSSNNVTSGNNNNNNQNAGNNPSTGGVSIYLMFLILIISLIGSISVYQKNLSNYNKN